MSKQSQSSASVEVAKNAYKALAANIGFTSIDDPICTLAIVSSVPSEGKTTTAANLSKALASGGNDVILLECDLRRRSLAGMLGVRGRRHGLYSVISGRYSWKDSVIKVQDHCYFLDAEPNIPNPADVLQSKRFKALLDQLKGSFRYVIIDLPPIKTFIDGAIVASMADGTLLVVRQDFVRRDDVRASYDQLQKAGANVIGTVLNCTKVEGASKYYREYRDYRDSDNGDFGTSPLQSNGTASTYAGGQAQAPQYPMSAQTTMPQQPPAATLPQRVGSNQQRYASHASNRR
jgi:capsular exopolysaccharide synthesis family protein